VSNGRLLVKNRSERMWKWSWPNLTGSSITSLKTYLGVEVELGGCEWPAERTAVLVTALRILRTGSQCCHIRIANNTWRPIGSFCSN
jgi:hypothetical protein